MTTISFFALLISPLFLPLTAWKIKISKNEKKMPGHMTIFLDDSDTWRYYHSTHLHQYDVWFMVLI